MKVLQKLSYFAAGSIMALAVLVAGTLLAQPSASDLMGVGLPGGLAEILGGTSAYDIVPTTDDTYDLGSASAEWKDAYFDGTVTLDALSMPVSVVAGANTACSTTCTGLCLFGVNTAATEADIVDCAGATADECLCVE